ncbi:hypothetical protein NFI96_007253 [Prochilodus magdalenae]|nr:hypothetical protein NFI96_007253 [Prochilodus magdalenae]
MISLLPVQTLYSILVLCRPTVKQENPEHCTETGYMTESISPLENRTQVHTVEEQTVTLSCKYDGVGVPTLFWYHQYPGSRPEYLLMIVPGSKPVSLGRLKAEVDKDLNRVDLKISSAAVSDSVLYYCALQPTVTGNPDTLYRNWFYDSCRAVLLSGWGAVYLCTFRPSSSSTSRASHLLEDSVDDERVDLVIFSTAVSDAAPHCVPQSAVTTTKTRQHSSDYLFDGGSVKFRLFRNRSGSSSSLMSTGKHISEVFRNLTGLRRDMHYQSCVSQSISPLEEKVDAVEGETVTLSCRYEYSGAGTPYLYWYRQYSESRPENLLTIVSGSESSGQLKAEVDVKNKRVDLKISSAAVSDSVLYYCALRPTVTGNPDTLYRNWFYCCTTMIISTVLLLSALTGLRAEDLITPNRDAVFTGEGQTVTLSCNYSGTANSLHWYQQYSGSPPQFLILDYSGVITEAHPPVPGILISHVKEQKKVDLKISSTAVSDSALYYCALEPTVTGNPDTLVLLLGLNEMDLFLEVCRVKLLKFPWPSGGSAADGIQPLFLEQHVLEGADVSLSCNYTGANVVGFQWYHQYPGSRPEFLLSLTESSNGSDPARRLTAEAKKQAKRLRNISHPDTLYRNWFYD